MYSIDGQIIHSLEDINNENLYVISNGEPYKKAYYHVRDGEVEMEPQPHVVPKPRVSINPRSHNVRNNSLNGSKSSIEKGIFTNTVSLLFISIYHDLYFEYLYSPKGIAWLYFKTENQNALVLLLF